jgi:hypothetical protein
VRTADRMYCAGFAIHVCIVGLSLTVRTMSYHIVLCGVCRMYCIVSLAVRIVSYHSVLAEEIQYEQRLICSVRGLAYMYVLYCKPIARGSYHVVL